MGRLIDADALIEVLKHLSYFNIEDMQKLVEKQPTAYDVEKVVAELEKQSYEIRLEGGALIDSWHSVIDTNIAIEIVKRGGVE